MSSPLEVAAAPNPAGPPALRNRLPPWRWLVAGLFILLAGLVPPLAGLSEQLNPDTNSKFQIFLGIAALILALWSVSYNLMLGYTGMVSFAHAAYYGIGAYTVALAFNRLHLPVLEGLILAPLVTAVCGFLSGLVALRAVRLYFSLLTLAISQVLYAVAFQWYDLTGGDSGIHNLTVPDQLGDYTNLYYFTAAVVAVCLLAMFVIVRSPFGAALATIRENRERARSVGLNVKAYELAVFTTAALFAGVAGGLFAVYQQEAYPGLMYWSANATPVVVTLLGGTGTFLGPFLGAFIYTVLDNQLSKNFANQFDIILGGIVLVVVLVVPGGFSALPQLYHTLRNRFRREDDRPVVEESPGDAISMLDLGRAAGPESVAEPPRSDRVLLKVENLSKRFGGLRAVERVNLEVRQGDRHAIIGPNGAGKSTLFNLITGRMRADQGTVTFDGRDVTGRPPHVIARGGIGRAFQITSIFPRLTVVQNLQYAMQISRGDARRPFGRADRLYRDQAMELLQAVGLAGFAELPAGQLSHGDQRAIELAISLALGSKMILLDEPTAGMSPFETQKAMELVRRIATERELTLLFCEHDMEVVFGTARTVTVMHQGRVLTEGSPDEVRSNPEVQLVYLGQLETAEAEVTA